MILFFFISSSLLFSFLRFSHLFSSPLSSLVLSLLLHVSFSFSLFLLLFSLFSFIFSFSLSFTAHTETRSTRQVTPPTKNGHAPRDPLNQERAINLSILAMSHPGSFRVLSQIRPQAPLLVVPIRSMPDFHVQRFICAAWVWTPPFSRDTVYRKIKGRKHFTKSAAEDV